MDLLIKNEKISICRYGDGELDLLLFQKKINFQKSNENLSLRLKQILFDVSNDNHCLVCLPDSFRSIKNMRPSSRFYWYKYLSYNFLHINKILNENYVYGNASITRPYYDYKNNIKANEIFNKFQAIIKSKNILIIEGCGTRLGVGNDLLLVASSIKRITTVNKDAFSLYEKIYQEAVLHSAGVDLVLISLGPTATVLAYDLSRRGIRSIDTGHIDIEYEWMLKGADKKINIEGKNVNESGVEFEEGLESASQDYFDQIILHIGH
ncbi:GT-D fold domain-containing glycosyltransferase [Rosenbergiella epipactidis]|uniref:GT-D fold domain-containing glycosyltransferase n=1 Tax=Rosenbergiella epipactidis TaxID=1544694 RepID=UPI0020260D02|nr:GT-D fold domain-containing glycosyltransferase [Rosenbergiella epipactidis]MCL9667434.1 GT-D fold domain-containing glycosyltransferase [Rosenbergiella epipactidis]